MGSVMFWRKKKEKPEPRKIEFVQKMVMVDLWYVDDDLPNVLQSWTWQTVDEAPEFPRAMEWISSMSEQFVIHHWQIKEYERPVPHYIPALVHPITPIRS